MGPKGNIYATGWFSETGRIGAVAVASAYNVTDVYLAKISASGTVKWAKHGTSMLGLALAPTADSIYVVGEMLGNAIFGTIRTGNNGSYDGVVWKAPMTP